VNERGKIKVVFAARNGCGFATSGGGGKKKRGHGFQKTWTSADPDLAESKKGEVSQESTGAEFSWAAMSGSPQMDIDEGGERREKKNLGELPVFSPPMGRHTLKEVVEKR